VQVQSPAEQLFFTTVRLEVQNEAGGGAGTGFFYSYSDDDKQYIFVVSNKHVVLDAKRGTMVLTLAEGDQPRLGEKFTLTVEDFGAQWFGHPDVDTDIAVMPFVPMLNRIQETGKRVYFKVIAHDLIPDRASVEQLDAIEEVIFVGYPNGIFDAVNLTPLARVGITATPIALDYGGKKAFLIDASVFPGSSGSPVFILNTGSYTPKGGGLVVAPRLLFLGILSAVFVRLQRGEFEMADIPTAQVPVVTTEQMIDIGYVYKGDMVQDTVNQFLARGGAN